MLNQVFSLPSATLHALQLPTHYPQLATHQEPLMPHVPRLAVDSREGARSDNDASSGDQEQQDIGQVFRMKQAREIRLRLSVGPLALCLGCFLVYRSGSYRR